MAKEKAKQAKKSHTYTVLSIDDAEIPRLFAALERLDGKLDGPMQAADGGPISGTKCGATNITAGNGNYDFSCKD